MSSIPVIDPSVDPRAAITIAGELPSPIDPPSGCRFRTRCPSATELCAEEAPVLRELRTGQFVACHHPVETLPTGEHVILAGRRAVGRDLDGEAPDGATSPRPIRVAADAMAWADPSTARQRPGKVAILPHGQLLPRARGAR